MANVIAWRIQFTGNNPYGNFASGDAVDIYFDNTTTGTGSGSTDGISVFKNGVQIFNAGDIALGSTDYFHEQEALMNSGVCVGTTLATFKRELMAFPYITVTYLPDYPSCSISEEPPTCDLILVGVPQVTNASGEGIADGEIIINATSSNSPIQYKIGSTFVYNDGSGHQSSGTFTGLLPGTYIIYLRDSLNCGTLAVATVGINDTYGPYYRLTYNDIIGGVTQIDILKLDYAGSVTNVKGAAVPFERALKGEASQDKFESVLATKATVNLTSETVGAFSGIYTNNPEEFRIKYYKNSALNGMYKVLPQQHSEEHTRPPYYVSVVATDGLPALKDYVFLQDDGQRFHQTMKAIELIAYILKKTKLELNIRVAINLYATGMNTAATDDPLDQAYVDCDAYYINETEPTLDYVLRQILEPFGASIVQENAVWNIVRVEEKRATYDYREFTSAGVYVSNSSYNPLLDVNLPTTGSGFYFSDRDQFLTMCPGYGKIRVFYKLGLRENILENGDFRLRSAYDSTNNTYYYSLDTYGFQLIHTSGTLYSNWESVTQTRLPGGVFNPLVSNDDTNKVAWKIEAGVGESGYIQSDTYNIKMGVDNSLQIAVRFKRPAVGTVNFRVQYGSYYLQDDGTWTTTETNIGIPATEANTYIEYEITATQPDSGAANGYDFNARLYVSNISVDYIKVAFLSNGAMPLDTILREINAESRNTAVLEKQLSNGSYQSLIVTVPQFDFGVGRLTATSGATMSLITTNVLAADILYAGYFRDSTGAGYATWTRDGISEETSLHAIFLQQYAAQYKRSWRKITGSLYSDNTYFSFLNVLRVTTDSNRLYLPISPTIDDRNNRVRGEFLELIDITSGAGSDGSGNSPFSSGFTTGFGSGFN